MATVTENADAYQSIERLRERVEYEAGDFFSDNAQLRFDELLVELEAESRGIFETLWGDTTPLNEDGKQEVRQATDDAALSLTYPVRDVSTVEVRFVPDGDWQTLDARRYTHTEHHLILESGTVPRTRYQRYERQSDARFAAKPTWVDFCEQLRVTYDRGFGTEPPADILSVQVQLVNGLLRQLRLEQTVEAASPDEYRAMTDGMEIVSDEIRQRVDDVTSPGRATMAL